MTKELEALDARLGRTVTIEDWRRLGEKADAELTQDDLTIIEAFSGPKAAAAARERRMRALSPHPADVPAPETKTAPTMADVTQDEATTAILDAINVALQDPTAKLARLEERFAALLDDKAKLRDNVLVAAVERSKSVTHIETLEKQVQALQALVESRLAGMTVVAIESKPSMKFCGVWRQGGSYEPGDAVTHQGGLWICKAPTSGEPSKDFSGWTLAVKRGSA